MVVVVVMRVTVVTIGVAIRIKFGGDVGEGGDNDVTFPF